jgi:hypothetical protein
MTKKISGADTGRVIGGQIRHGQKIRWPKICGLDAFKHMLEANHRSGQISRDF